MKRYTIYIYGSTPVFRFAGQYLQEHGIDVVTSPTAAVTHLLLGVPNRLPEREIDAILSSLPKNVTVVGGKLQRSGIDLLRDPAYLEENALLTAYCALCLGMEKLPMIPEYCPSLIIGWGRIGKNLARLLKILGSDVTVASGSAEHRAEARNKGYRVVDSGNMGKLDHYRLVYNTAPAPIVSEAQAREFQESCVILELASVPGIAGDRPIAALGLPGKMVPESSGKLIGSTLLRVLQNKEENI